MTYVSVYMVETIFSVKDQNIKSKRQQIYKI